MELEDLAAKLHRNQDDLVSLQRAVIQQQTKQMEHNDKVAAQLADIKDLISQAKGGWKVALTFSGILVTLGGFSAWILDSVIFKK